MKYYADYQRDNVYAIDEKKNYGISKTVEFIDTHSTPVKFKLETHEFHITEPLPTWTEENQCIFEHKPITKEDFDGYGKTWIWNPSPAFGVSEERLSI